MQMRLMLIIHIFAFSIVTAATPIFAEEKSSIRIGVILPLTGPLAEFGVAMQNGIKLAQEGDKKNLGTVEFVYEDSQYNPQTAITIFKKFITDPNIKFIINFGCPTSQALVPLAEQTHTPTAVFCSALLLTKDKKYSIGMTSPANEWADILWQYLNKKEFKNICLVLTQNDYLLNEYRALQAEFESHGRGDAITLLDQYTPQETDFRSSVLKLGRKSCDALGVYLLPGQIRAFFDQTRHLNLKTQVFGTDVFESVEEIVASKGAMEGSIFVNLAVPLQFKDRYRSAFHNENQMTMACVAHDLVIRVGTSLSKDDAGSSSATLMKMIQDSGEQGGECGISKFVVSDTGEQFVRFPVVLKRIEGDKIRDF